MYVCIKIVRVHLSVIHLKKYLINITPINEHLCAKIVLDRAICNEVGYLLVLITGYFYCYCLSQKQCDFIEYEAVLSDQERGSSDEDDSEMDVYEDSFVNDSTQMTQDNVGMLVCSMFKVK